MVSYVRKLTGIRRVGHAGTLDPMATGVLVICVGVATRVSEYLMDSQKSYRARVLLGVTTDTYDAEGQVVASIDHVDVDRAQVEVALASFCGVIAQVPPMYSALKHRGKRLYQLARQGVTVERPPRQVEIFRLALTEWNPPECTLEITCSAGTYVRSIAHDLGQRLGCGAHLVELVRTASGRFLLADAVTQDALVQAVADGRWPTLLLPIDAGVAHFPVLRLDFDRAKRLCLGQAIVSAEAPDDEGISRVYGPDGTFLALAVFDATAGTWRPHKVFRSPD
jgi:tRNA pseudouridine55 synthase